MENTEFGNISQFSQMPYMETISNLMTPHQTDVLHLLVSFSVILLQYNNLPKCPTDHTPLSLFKPVIVLSACDSLGFQVCWQCVSMYT